LDGGKNSVIGELVGSLDIDELSVKVGINGLDALELVERTSDSTRAACKKKRFG
jgi:hypothetical protein